MFAEMEKMQVKALAWGENGFRQLTNDLRPVRISEDMKGLRLKGLGFFPGRDINHDQRSGRRGSPYGKKP